MSIWCFGVVALNHILFGINDFLVDVIPIPLNSIHLIVPHSVPVINQDPPSYHLLHQLTHLVHHLEPVYRIR